MTRRADTRRVLFSAMQEDAGPNYSFDKKRKAVEDSDSVVNLSGKRTRMSKSQADLGETVKAEPQWPDYFKEVSVRENSLKLTLGTSFRQLFKVRSVLILVCHFPTHLSLYLDIQGPFCQFRRLDLGQLCSSGIEHGISILHFKKTVCYFVQLPPCFH